MKFNINDYKGKYVMHCHNEEEAGNFCDYMAGIGRYLSCSLWCYSGQNVIFFNNGTWGSKDYAKKEGYEILEWSDFINKEFTKADLKTGDVVKFKCGKVGIANCELGMFIGVDWWLNLDSLREDLTSKKPYNYDVEAVRRPLEKGDCQFCAFDGEYGTLVYERKEVEEMTLAQVCKLLGKEIKIIQGSDSI